MKTSDYRGILFNFWNDYWTENRDIIPAVCYAHGPAGHHRRCAARVRAWPAYGPLQRNIYNDENVEHYDYDPEKAKIHSGIRRLHDGRNRLLRAKRRGDRLRHQRHGRRAGPHRHRPGCRAAAARGRHPLHGGHSRADGLGRTAWHASSAGAVPFDADDHTYKVFGTDKGANYSGYSNEKVDEYLTKARESSDPAVRKEYYDLFQIELANDPAYAFICYIDANYVASARLHGISTDTVMGHHGVGIFWNVCEWTLD